MYHLVLYRVPPPRLEEFLGWKPLQSHLAAIRPPLGHLGRQDRLDMETRKGYSVELSGCSSRGPNGPADPRPQWRSTYLPGANRSQKESNMQANRLPWAHTEKKGNYKLEKSGGWGASRCLYPNSTVAKAGMWPHS